MSICKHNNHQQFCVHCYREENGIVLHLPPEKKRSVVLYEARKEFYELYSQLNKEHFEGKLPWVQLYLNGRLNADKKVKLYFTRTKKTKELEEVSIEMTDRMPTTISEHLLKAMQGLKELLETGKLTIEELK